MTAKDESLIVQLVKKAVGLPTANSNCCGPVAVLQAKDCCDKQELETASADCNCATTPAQPEARPAQP